MMYAYFVSFHSNTGIIVPIGVSAFIPSKSTLSKMIADSKQVPDEFEILIQVEDALASVWLDKPERKIGLITITKIKIYG